MPSWRPSWPHVRVWINPSDVGRHHASNVDKREQICSDIDAHGFDWQIFAVAASGFLTDSYNLFATNVILPSLAYVYWYDNHNTNFETDINAITLAGSCIGQVVFGHLADRYGRRRLYGLELIVVIFGTLGLVQASSGYNGNMNILAWIMVWRFFVGVGIGAEYPLSAVITAEFAPRRARARMMASVFAMQPVGQVLATSVGLAVLMTVGKNGGLADNPDQLQAATVLDSIWRWIIGVGAIPALIAIGFRLTIPESPRYTLDVDNDGARALRDTEQYYNIGPRENGLMDMDGDVENGDAHLHNPALQQVPAAAHHYHDGDYEDDGDDMEMVPSNDDEGPVDDDDDDEEEEEEKKVDPFSFRELKQFFWTEGNIKYLIGTSGAWFLLDFAFYGLGINNPRTIAHIWSPSVASTPAGGITAWQNPATPDRSIYDTLYWDGVQSIITVSVGSLLGSIILIKAINYVPRRSWLAWSFVGMGLLFAVIGGSYFAVVNSDLHALTITLYVLCQLLFNLGPNTLTFIIPAEIFPTRYRATCHGISAAAGKVGSVIVQSFLGKIGLDGNTSKSLGWLLIAFSPIMLLGAILTWGWIPDVQDPRGTDTERIRGKKQRFNKYVVPSKSLEELAKGMAGVTDETRQIGFRHKSRLLMERMGGRRRQRKTVNSG